MFIDIAFNGTFVIHPFLKITCKTEIKYQDSQETSAFAWKWFIGNLQKPMSSNNTKLTITDNQ